MQVVHRRCGHLDGGTMLAVRYLNSDGQSDQKQRQGHYHFGGDSVAPVTAKHCSIFLLQGILLHMCECLQEAF